MWEDQGWGASDWLFKHANFGAWEKVSVFGSDRSSWYDCTRRSSIIEAGAWEKVAIYGSWEHFHRKLGHRIGCKTQGPHSHTQYGNVFPRCRCIHFSPIQSIPFPPPVWAEVSTQCSYVLVHSISLKISQFCWLNQSQ